MTTRLWKSLEQIVCLLRYLNEYPGQRCRLSLELLPREKSADKATNDMSIYTFLRRA